MHTIGDGNFAIMSSNGGELEMRKSLTKSGIDVVGDVPWGTHFCHFYQTDEDLTDTVAPYFKAGLENNELCIWTIPKVLNPDKAKETLKRAIPDFETYLGNGQIEIMPLAGLINEGVSDSDIVISAWVEKLNQALAVGYSGLRISRELSLPEDRDNFTDYEEKLDRIIENYRMIVLCSYSLESCSATEVIEIVNNHRFISIKKRGKRAQIESARCKKVEENIQNLANIVESSLDAILTESLDGTIKSWNRGAEQTYGYSAREILGRPMSVLEPPRLFEETNELLEMVEQGDKVRHYETLQLRKDGKVINVSLTLSPIYGSSGKLSSISVIARDISERKKAEAELRKREERYRIVTEQTGQLVYEYDLRTNKSSWAGAIEEVTGYSREEFEKLGTDVWLNNICPTNNGSRYMDSTDTCSVSGQARIMGKKGGRFKEELRLKRKDGTWIYVENSGVCITDNEGHAYEAIGVLKDITGSKLAKVQLQESEERYRMATEQTGQIIFDFRLETRRVNWAGAIKEVTGYPLEEFENFEETAWIEHVHPEDRAELLENLMMAFEKGEKIQAEYRFRKKDGSYIYMEIRGVWLKNEESEVYRAIGVIKDINEMRLSQEMLKASEKRYRLVTEQTGQLVYDFGLISDEVNWAGAIEEITGYTIEEFQNKGRVCWVGNIHPDDRERVAEEFTEARKNRKRYTLEYRFRKKDGTYAYLENNGVFLQDKSGFTARALGALRDITERKISEGKLQESERKYRSFIQNFHGIAFQADEHFIPIFLHGAVEEITGYSEEEFMSLVRWKDIIHPEDLPLVHAEDKKIQDSQKPLYGENDFRIIRKDGKIRWVHEIYQKIQRKDGVPEFYQGTIYDVTERKEAEKFLTNIEATRKKEIHHRIKNNLQIISSLLDLQAEKFKNRECIEDSEILEAFRDSQDRVISMALIHEELYKGGGLDTLNFSSYIEELVGNLFMTYRLGNTDISLKMDLEENVFFDMDTAIPLGIIINELVSNSLKYAFVDRDYGIIQIKLCREKSQESRDNRAGSNNESLKGKCFTLTVSDNGVGVPESFDLENPDSLGIQLVTTLVDQLEGEIKLKRNKGTEFIIRFTVA